MTSKLISKGGGVFARTEKSIKISPEIRALLGIDAKEIEPSALMTAILKAPVQLLWFGGIGTYIKDRSEGHLDVGDPGNDAIRVNGADVQAQRSSAKVPTLASRRLGVLATHCAVAGSTPTSSTTAPAWIVRIMR
jgi:hypothetical protein